MELDPVFEEELEQLNDRWDEFISDDLSEYAFADAALDEKRFASLIHDTARALDKAMPRKADEGLMHWEQVVILISYLSIYSKYPTVADDAITLGFDASKLIVERLAGYFRMARDRGEPWDIFSDFQVIMCGLPDDYEKNKYGDSYIPYSFSEGDLTPLKNAIRDGGQADIWFR